MIDVSFCITCKGRLHHLRNTLPFNLAAEASNPNVEFVLLDYDSRDGLQDWVEQALRSELAGGRVVYARHEPAPTFKMAHSKNMAHRLGSGRILCNVDADNLLPQNFSHFLIAEFNRDPNLVFSPRKISVAGFLRQAWIDRRLGLAAPDGGLSGRIAIGRDAFHRIGGYAEGFSAWGADDIELLLRARDLGLHVRYLPPDLWGGVIDHTDEERTENLSASDKVTSVKRLDGSRLSYAATRIGMILKRDRKPANLGLTIGAGRVRQERRSVQAV